MYQRLYVSPPTGGQRPMGGARARPIAISGTSGPAALTLALTLAFAATQGFAAPSPTGEGHEAAEHAAPASGTHRSPYAPRNLTQGVAKFYASTLGVDALKVSRTNAGNLIRFSYRIVDPAKALAISDRNAKPVLIGHTSRAVLQVPVMDKVGPLRQATSPMAGQQYWIVFSNKGDVVKTGERVSVVVGNFRIDGLRVE